MNIYIYIYLYIYIYMYVCIGTQWKCIKRWKQSSAIKQLLETLFFAIKMWTGCTGFTTDDTCMNTICAVSPANHLRAVADAFRPLRTHQRYWTTGRWTPQKWSHSNRWHTDCGESRKYILKHNQNAYIVHRGDSLYN